MQRVSLLPSNPFAVNPEGQNVLFFQRAVLKLLKGLLSPLLKPAAHRRLAQAEPVDKLAGHLLVVSLREPQQNGLYHLRTDLRAFHRLVAFQGPLLLRVGVSNARHVDRNLLSVDPDRTGVRAPSAQAVSLLLSTVALSGETSDFLLEEFLGLKASHFCVVLNQMELRVDRAVEDFSKRLGGWRLFGVGAMLRSHRQGFFVGEKSLLVCTGEEPLLRIEFQLTLSIRPSSEQLYIWSNGVKFSANRFGPCLLRI